MKEKRGGARPGAGRPKGYRPAPKPDPKHRVSIRISKQEKEKIKIAAEEAGKTFSAFVREAALEKCE